jgi:hypothetical protein
MPGRVTGAPCPTRWGISGSQPVRARRNNATIRDHAVPGLVRSLSVQCESELYDFLLYNERGTMR